MGVANRLVGDTQPVGRHGASICLEPSPHYLITLTYDLRTWDAYNDPAGGRGYWDSFSFSVTDGPFAEMKDLSDPLNFFGLEDLWGGTQQGERTLESYTGTRTFTVAGSNEINSYLNVVLDTATKEDAHNLYPSWGVVAVQVVSPPRGIERVAFSGAKYWRVRSDNGTTLYNAPHWLDTNLNGDTTDSGDRQYPVAYSAGSTPFFSATIVLSAMLVANPLLVKGEGTYDIDIPPTVATRAGNRLTISDVAATRAFDEWVTYYQFAMTWSVSADNGVTWMQAGVTGNQLYITLRDPLLAVRSSIYQTVVHLGSSNALGETDDAGTVPKIWNDFTDHDVRRVDGRKMTYWATRQATCQTMVLMLAHKAGDGSCLAWSQLFHNILAVQGIDGSMIVNIQPDRVLHPGANGLLVKNWNFDRHITTGPNGVCNTTANPGDYQAAAVGSNPGVNQPCVTPGANGQLETALAGDDTFQDGLYVGEPFPYLRYRPQPGAVFHGDVAAQPGMAGQGTLDPLSDQFDNHYVVKYQGQVYDPSYGTGPHPSDLAHEDASIDGLYSLSGEFARVKKHTLGVRQLVYTPLP